MGRRKVVVKQSASESIAAIAWYIESKGLIATADRFIDNIYDHFLKLADEKKILPHLQRTQPGKFRL
jgi:plasmid stabilization system protein ParE